MGTCREIELETRFLFLSRDVARIARMERERRRLGRVGERQERRESNLDTPTLPGEGECENAQGAKVPAAGWPDAARARRIGAMTTMITISEATRIPTPRHVRRIAVGFKADDGRRERG